MRNHRPAGNKRILRLIALAAALILLAGGVYSLRQARTNTASLMIGAQAESTAKPWKDLKKGSSGPQVQRIQTALQGLGYYDGRADGNFSKAFEEAVLAFQKDWGLEENGVIDAEVFALLTEDLPDVPPTAAPTPTAVPAPVPSAAVTPAAAETPFVERGQDYSDKDHVAAYLRAFGELPPNYITKREAREMGWVASLGNLWKVAPEMSIGGDRFGNYEGQLPRKSGRVYYECDIDYDKDYRKYNGGRNGKRIVFSNDGLIFYTGDHYQTFEEIAP